MKTPIAIGLICLATLSAAPAPDRAAGTIQEFDNISYVWCPPGTFIMGTDKGYFDERPAREITFTKGFWIGQFEVTQAQWEAIMGENPSSFPDPNHPVETITHFQAIEFAKKLSESTGATYRLPTEAEWEYACRAGTTTKYNFGDDPAALSDHAWFRDNAEDTTHPPGQKKPNAWNIHDAHGNVAEWCSDWYVSGYDPEDTTDPKGPDQIRDAVVRGGGWADSGGYLRSGARYRMNFIFARSHIGLRLVREAD